MNSRRSGSRVRALPAEPGFTLVELMIVILVATILMALAWFAFGRARASANEASAIASLKAVNSGQVSYIAGCGRGFFAASLPILGTPPHAAAQTGYINPELASAAVVQHSGYRLRVQIGVGGANGAVTDCNGNPTVTAYYATAVPVAVGETGARAFATNQIGTIWQSADGIVPAEPFGPPAEIAR